jgi:hypothetical protein
MTDARKTDDAPNPRVVRERLASALDDARELVRDREKDIRRCLGEGLAWNHPAVRTHRLRLAAALADVQMLELMVRPVSPQVAGTLSAPITPLTTRR